MSDTNAPFRMTPDEAVSVMNHVLDVAIEAICKNDIPHHCAVCGETRRHHLSLLQAAPVATCLKCNLRYQHVFDVVDYAWTTEKL